LNLDLENKKVEDETNLQVLNDVRQLMKDELGRRSAEFNRTIALLCQSTLVSAVVLCYP
jgi:hypothetical protein